MRRLGLLIWLCVSCGDASSPTTLPPAPLQQPTLSMQAKGAPVLHLSRMLSDAEFSLSTGHAPDANQPKQWSLSSWTNLPIQGIAFWHHDVPFIMSQRSFAQQPEGISLQIAGKTLQYKPGLLHAENVDPIDVEEGRWEIRAGRIIVVGPNSPEDLETVLIDTAINTVLARKDFGSANMPAVEFASTTIEKGLQTRRSILLPPPAVASFTVTVPPQARLTFGIGVESVEHDKSPAKSRFQIAINGDAVFDTVASSADEWADHAVDLSAHAGSNVTVELKTLVEGSARHAFAAFSAPKIVGALPKDGPSRVVVVGLDTLRKDHVGVHGYKRPVSPGMDAIASQSIVFEEAWTPAPRTRPSFRSATTGRWPLSAVNAPTLGEIFSINGWSTAGFVANVQLAPRLGFADGFDHWSYDNMADGDLQVDRTLEWLNNRPEEDAFVFLHMMDPHIFYEAPEPFLDRYTDDYDNEGLRDRYNRWDIDKRLKSGRLSDTQQEWIKARYDGEISFMDRELVRLITGLDALPGDTTVVFHTDHGEEFWDHGGFEHNHSLYNELVAAILWVRPPRGWGGGPHRIQSPVSLIDIAPTVASLATLDPSTFEFEGIDLSPFISADRKNRAESLSQSLEQRPLPLGHMMFNKEQWGVVHNDTKYILHTASGTQEMYDLSNDSAETINLAETESTIDMQGALSQATGWPVLSGWRLQFSQLPHETTISFKKPVGRTFVLDPEVGRMRRANLEWGEVPPVSADDVGTISVNEERTKVTIDPGEHPSGILFIEGLGTSDKAMANCKIGGSNVRPNGGASLCSRRATLTVGPLLLQQENESGNLRDSPEEQTVQALRSLGYLD